MKSTDGMTGTGRRIAKSGAQRLTCRSRRTRVVDLRKRRIIVDASCRAVEQLGRHGGWRQATLLGGLFQHFHALIRSMPIGVGEGLINSAGQETSCTPAPETELNRGQRGIRLVIPRTFPPATCPSSVFSEHAVNLKEGRKTACDFEQRFGGHAVL